jgi:hypothetical protein
MAIAIESSGYVTDATQPAATSNQTSAFNVGAGGRLIVVAIGCPTLGTAPTVTGVTDTLGNTYATPATAHQRTGSGCAELWLAWSTASGSNQVTVQTSQQGSGICVTAYCLSGAQQTVGASAVGPGTTPPRVLITPTAIGSLIFAAGADYAGNTARTVTTNSTLDRQALDDNNDASWNQHLTSPTTNTNQLTIGTTAPASTDYAVAALEVLAATGSINTETPSDSATGSTTVSSALTLGETRADFATASNTITDAYAPANTEVLSDSASMTNAVAAAQAAAEARSDSATGTTTETDSDGWARGAVDPIGLPPNGQYPYAVDTSSRPQLLRDANPAGRGDLLGLFKTPGDVYYLVLSTNGGASWPWLEASSGSPPPADGYYLQDQAICQDTVGYKVHWATVPQHATSVRYHRIALEYGEDGHVSGWHWEAANQPGPALNTESGAHQGKADIQEILDGSGNHVLLIVGIDQPSGTRIARLVAACTSAGANALAPTLATHWTKLDGSAGVSVLCARNTDTGVDTAAMLNLTNVQVATAVHNYDCTAAQLDNGDLAVFFGPMYFNDPDDSGDIRRWRFTRSGGTWALDSGVNGAVVVAVSATSKPCMGNAVAQGGYAWFTYWSPTGLHVGRVNSSGTWMADAVTQPDTSHGAQSGYVWGWSAIGFGRDGTLCIQYERDDVFAAVGSRWIEFSGYLSGSAWVLSNDLTLWQRSSGYTSGNSDGSTSWSSIRGAHGAGVFAYPYVDWATGHPHFSVHSLQKYDAAQAYEEAPADSGQGSTTVSAVVAATEARSDSTATADVVAAAQSSTEAPADSGQGATTVSATLAATESRPDGSATSDAATASQAAQEARADSTSSSDTVSDSHATQGQEAPSDAAVGTTAAQDAQAALEARADSATGATAEVDAAAALESRQDAVGGTTSVVEVVRSAGEVDEPLSDEARATDIVSEIAHGVGAFARMAATRPRTRTAPARARTRIVVAQAIG